jgi:5-methylcytosine-specific restriction endonuclease McrA
VNDKTKIMEQALNAVLKGNADGARSLIQQQYPFTSPISSIRKYTPLEMTRIFIRDGFIDRYSGQRLVFPPVLRLLSKLLPTEFPYHRNWKMTDCHIAYWELFPTVDHVVPIARGGRDEETNWVTTSMLRNSAKANWTLDELGWKLVPAGELKEWDGLMGCFLQYAQQHPELLKEQPFKMWARASAASLNKVPAG